MKGGLFNSRKWMRRFVVWSYKGLLRLIGIPRFSDEGQE